MAIIINSSFYKWKGHDSEKSTKKEANKISLYKTTSFGAWLPVCPQGMASLTWSECWGVRVGAGIDNL